MAYSQDEISYDAFFTSFKSQLVLSSDTEDELPSWVVERIVRDSKETSSSTQKEILSASSIQEAIASLPCVKKCHAEFLSPHQLFISYTLRTPLGVIVSDQDAHHSSSIGFDIEGTQFPLSPFYAPKFLPQVILDMTATAEEVPESASTGDNLASVSRRNTQRAARYVELMQKRGLKELPSSVRLHSLDLSKIDHYCYFQREIVAVYIAQDRLNRKTKDGLRRIFFRFHPSSFEESHALCGKLFKYLYSLPDEKGVSDAIFDLRYRGFCLFTQKNGAGAENVEREVL